MGRAEQESTARIKRETLAGLLDTMAPADQQPITARVRISDIQAEAAMAVTLAEPSPVPLRVELEITKPVEVGKVLEALKVAEAVNVANMLMGIEEPLATPRRELAKGTDQVAALPDAKVERAQLIETRVVRMLAELTAIAEAKSFAQADETSDFETVTRINVATGEAQPLFNDVDWDELLGAAVSAMLTPDDAKAHELVPTDEQKAVQVIADVREKLELASETAAQCDAERPSFPTLSPQIAAALSGEEISMLPMEIRLMLPESQPFPRIAMTPQPVGDVCIAIHSTPSKELGHSIRVSEKADAPSWPAFTLVAYFVVACLAGFSAAYCLA